MNWTRGHRGLGDAGAAHWQLGLGADRVVLRLQQWKEECRHRASQQSSAQLPSL